MPLTSEQVRPCLIDGCCLSVCLSVSPWPRFKMVFGEFSFTLILNRLKMIWRVLKYHSRLRCSWNVKVTKKGRAGGGGRLGLEKCLWRWGLREQLHCTCYSSLESSLSLKRKMRPIMWWGCRMPFIGSWIAFDFLILFVGGCGTLDVQNLFHLAKELEQPWVALELRRAFL